MIQYFNYTSLRLKMIKIILQKHLKIIQWLHGWWIDEISEQLYSRLNHMKKFGVFWSPNIKSTYCHDNYISTHSNCFRSLYTCLRKWSWKSEYQLIQVDLNHQKITEDVTVNRTTSHAYAHMQLKYTRETPNQKKGEKKKKSWDYEEPCI